MSLACRRIKIARRAFLALCSFFVAACDILRPSPFCVTGKFPEKEVVSAFDTDSIRVTFSRDPDRWDAERAFGASRDGSTIHGTFSWDGRTMIFFPAEGIEEGHDYEATVSTEADDEAGVSLDNPFSFRFTTKAERVRPYITSTAPENGGSVDTAFENLTVKFSEPMDFTSFLKAVSMKPGVRGIWTANQDDSAFTFAPGEGFKAGTFYDVTVSSSCRDANGNGMGEDFAFRFGYGMPFIRPMLVSVRHSGAPFPPTVPLAEDILGDGVVTVNEGIERGWNIVLAFDAPVTRKSLLEKLSLGPESPFTIDETEVFLSSATMRFEEGLRYGTDYVLTVGEGIEGASGGLTENDRIFRLKADGEGSRPPEFVSLNLLSGGAVTEFTVANPYQTAAIPDGDLLMDLYFRVAAGATLDPYSLMDAFSISGTNSCAAFSLRKVQASGFALPLPEAKAGLAVLRVIALADNRETNSGIVTFTVEPGLRDSSDNVSAESVSVIALK